MNGPMRSLRKNQLLQIGYVAVVVCLLAMGRAYATDNLSLPIRLGMWSIIVGLVVFQTRVFFSAIKAKFSLPGMAEITALMITLFVSAAELAILKYTPLLPKGHDPYFEFVLFMMPMVFILGGGALLLDRLVPTLQKPSVDVSDNELCSKILTVQAQEHYLLVTTAQGTTMQRGRLRDQVAKLKDMDGLQVHRSWWVARAAVIGVLKRERDYVIQLISGETVPVARSKVALLRDSGWM